MIMIDIRLLAASADLATKCAEMAENDPHGIIITIVSVSVVFSSLIILYFAYSMIGKFVNLKRIQPSADTAVESSQQHIPTPEEVAVITLALQEYLDDSVHDKESYVITIKR